MERRYLQYWEMTSMKEIWSLNNGGIINDLFHRYTLKYI